MKDTIIDNKILGYMQIFQKVTRVDVKECLENEDMILFIVREHAMAEIFKNNPDCVSSIREKTNKHILIAETSKDLLNYVRNIFFRFGVREINISWKEGQTNIQVGVEAMEIGKAIGKEGRNVKLFKEAVSRSFNIHSLVIKQ